MVDKHDLKGTHWDHGHTPVVYESVTNESFMSENRNQIVRKAIRARTEPESMALGKFLRQTNVIMSMRPDKEPAKTEAKMRFVPQKIELSGGFGELRLAELRKANIDLAVGEDKSGKNWSSVLKSTMSANEDVKFACKPPAADAKLMEELRKSSVLLHAGKHDFRYDKVPVPRSTQKTHFDAKPISETVGFAATLGKELRTSNIDMACGQSRSGRQWQSQQHAIMENENGSKWACSGQAKGFDHLIAELRQTNISLGTDRVVYGSEGNKRPVKDDRKRAAAGDVTCNT